MTMPVGNEEKDGYRWNPTLGAWVDIKTGFLKGGSDEKKANQGVWQDAWDLTKDVGGRLTRAETWANPAGPNATGLLRVAGGLNTIFNPIANFGAAKVDLNKGNLKGALFNTALGAAGLFGGGQGLGGALTLAGRTAKAGSMGAKTFEALGAGLKGASGLRKAPVLWKGINPTKTGKALSLFGAGSAGLAVRGLLENKPGQPPVSSVLPGRDMAPTTTLPAETGRVIPGTITPGAPGSGGAGAPGTGGAGAGAGKVGLLPLTPDQLASTGESLTAIEKAYQDALNQYMLEEKQGNIGYTQAVQGARRQATGSAQDLASQMTAAGLDISPVSAFGAGQLVEEPRQAQETAARQGLDQLLASIKTGKTQAATQRDANKLMINRLIDQYRIANTLGSQEAAYRAMGGF